MSTVSDLYRRLCRLRTKQKRIQAQISNLERRLAGKRARWMNCSRKGNRES